MLHSMLQSNCNYGHPYISCFKGHNGKAYHFRDVPPLRNLRIWGMTALLTLLFTATAFRAGFTVGTRTWGKYPPTLGPKTLTTRGNHTPQITTERGWGLGGGHCLFEGKYPQTNYRPPVLCYHSPLSLPLLSYSTLISRYRRTAYCYYSCYRGLPPGPVDIIFSCPDTITLITVAKTLVIANPGCFPLTRHANNYSPNRKYSLSQPPF